MEHDGIGCDEGVVVERGAGRQGEQVVYERVPDHPALPAVREEAVARAAFSARRRRRRRRRCVGFRKMGELEALVDEVLLDFGAGRA